MVRPITAACGLAFALLAGVWAAGQALEPATHITAIRVARSEDATVIAVEGDGALPVPIAGAVDNPPRIFFDFPGLLTKTLRTSSAGDPFVRRVRAAVHSSEPLVTRVVLDLLAEAPFQIDRSDLANGRLLVRVGPATAAAPETPAAPPVKPPSADLSPLPVTGLPPVPQLPPAPAAGGGRAPAATAPPASGQPSPTSSAGSVPANPARPAPSDPPRADAPAAASPAPTSPPRRVGDKHRQQLGDRLDKARTLRPVLSAIDRSTMQSVEDLESAAAEFDSLGRALAGFKPPEALRATYDMVVRACTLGAMAARLRAQAERTRDESSARNAASAAAGALLLIDRACVELGCSP